MTEIYKDGARIDSEIRSVHDTGPHRGLRDQFAMAALTGMCAHPDCEGTYQDIAEQVYRLADAMLAARNAATQQGASQ